MTTANHVLLRRITLTATASSITFDSIPQTGYTDLKVVASARGTNADTYTEAKLRFNGATADTNLSSRTLMGSGSGTTGFSNSYIYCGPWVGATATANTYGNVEFYIPNYSSTSVTKSVSIDAVGENNATGAYQTLNAGLFNSTAAITSMEILPVSGSWAAGSSFSLYGIADVNTTPTVIPKAMGGDIVKTDGTYWYHAFISSGIFKPETNLTADVLVIAGGGGGGSGNNSGGGGAGGLLAFTSQALTATNYTCTIGAGGATGTPSGVNGADSQFGSLTLVKGGGYGGGDTSGAYPVIGGTGGSGGGSSFNYTSSGGAATSGQGYAGGAGQGGAPDYYGGGGGGSAEAGNTDSIGYGGDGLSTYSSWGLATATGQNVSGTVYYAGGGGGSGQSSSSVAQGGLGGGGNGAGTSAAVAGTPNTGGGGGGSGNSAGNTGKAGGSGIIIVRYAV